MWAPFCDTYAPIAEKDSSISAKERQQILQSAIDTYGLEHQVDMAIEEMAELMQALLRMRRPGRGKLCDVLDEMADVQIMLDQLRIIYGQTHDAEMAKLVRLQERVRDAQERMAAIR